MGHPDTSMYVALAAYVPFTGICFWALGGRRAMLVSLVTGWLLLPWFNRYGRAVPILHLKEAFVPAIVLGASLVLDSGSWRSLRLRSFDLPVLVATVSPFLTSLATGLGAYDGGSSALESFLVWGAPYMLGRVYLGTPAGALDAAKAVVLSGLVSLPLILWEIRMSPQLHRQLYGFHQHSFVQHIRDGHYRPKLFMSHALMVGMLMAAAALVAFWLWRTRALKDIAGIRLGWAASALVIGTFLCRTTGAFVVLLVGIAVLEGTRWMRAPILAIALALVPATYCSLRVAGWDTAPLVVRAHRWFGPERAWSLQVRLANETRLVARDLERPWLGWGRWDHSRLKDEEGRDITIADSMWIIAFGTTGLVGLISLGLILALPLLRFGRDIPTRVWDRARFAPAAALAVSVGIWAVDNLFNAMPSPVFLMMSGAVLSFCMLVHSNRPRRRTAPVPRVPATAPAPSA